VTIHVHRKYSNLLTCSCHLLHAVWQLQWHCLQEVNGQPAGQRVLWLQIAEFNLLVTASEFVMFMNDPCFICYTVKLTSMKQSPSSEGSTNVASQEIHNVLCSPKVQYCILNSPPLFLILSQINSTHALPSHSVRSILVLSSHLWVGPTSGLFSSGFPNPNLYTFLSPTCHTLAHFIRLCSITKIIFAMNTHHKAHHHAVFSSLLLLPPS